MLKANQIKYGKQLICYEVRNRARVTRNLHLETDLDGGLVVVAPKRMSRRAIRAGLQRKVHHVVRFLERARQKQRDLGPLEYIRGEKHLLQGVRYPLVIEESARRKPTVFLVDEQIVVITPQAGKMSVSGLMRGWYRQQADLHFHLRIDSISQRAPWVGSGAGGSVVPMRLRRMKRTWGSCSSKGVITLNPHLVKAPPRLIDHVIAHEICHLSEMNHGRAFYALQERLNPGWREHRAELRDRGHVFLHE